MTRQDAYICDATRTPVGRYGGVLSGVRTDDLGAISIKALIQRNANVDWHDLDDVYYGCANQAGEDNRNISRMASLLAGLPLEVPGATINRLCGSGLDALSIAARAIKCGEADLMIAGGVESMSRAPFVMGKAKAAFDRNAEIFDTTIGWRFVNKSMQEKFGIDSMPETAENIAEDFTILREDQDAFALRSQQRYQAAFKKGVFKQEITPVTIMQRKGDDIIIATDEHPRADTKLESLAKLSTPFRDGGSVTAGNAAGINDGACAILVASEAAIKKHKLTPLTRVVATATVGVEPQIMGFGPAPATRKVLDKTGLSLDQIDVIELNEAFAAQALAVTRDLELPDDAERVNPNGGAIAIGHPLGMSGARLATTASYELKRRNGKYALCTMCIGVGQGIAMILENV